MRILAVTPYYAPEGGGLERYAHEMLRRLAERGHAVRAFAATRSAPGVKVQDGVRVERRRPAFALSNAPVSFSLPLRLARAAREVDVVYAHGPVPGAIEPAAFAARVAGKPFVVTYHAGALTSVSAPGRALAAIDAQTLEGAALSAATRLVAVSSHVAENRLQRWREKTVVVPPGVDLDRFVPARQRAEAVFFASPLTDAYRWKGVDVLLEAFARLPRGALWIAGEGRRAPEILARARELGIRARLHLWGRLDDAPFAARMARARVVAAPSLTDAESFGMVAAEANACGLPVVASDVGGLPCFVRDGENGLLVPPGDVDALAGALRSLLASPEKAREMGARGRALVERSHRWDDLARRVETILTEACGREARGAEERPVRSRRPAA